MIEWKPLLGWMLGKVGDILSSAFVENGKEWWRKSLNWIHHKTAPPSTSLPAPTGGHCEQEEVETTPPSSSKIWRVRGYGGKHSNMMGGFRGNSCTIEHEEWVKSRAKAIEIGNRLLFWDNYPDPDGAPICQGFVVKNVATGEIAHAVGDHPKQHNRKIDVSHLPATDPDDPNDLPEEDIPF